MLTNINTGNTTKEVTSDHDCEAANQQLTANSRHTVTSGISGTSPITIIALLLYLHIMRTRGPFRFEVG